MHKSCTCCRLSELDIGLSSRRRRFGVVVEARVNAADSKIVSDGEGSGQERDERSACKHACVHGVTARNGCCNRHGPWILLCMVVAAHRSSIEEKHDSSHACCPALMHSVAHTTKLSIVSCSKVSTVRLVRILLQF